MLLLLTRSQITRENVLPEFVCWLTEYKENNWEGPVDSLNWCLYNILLVKFIGDVAYRIGLG